MNKPFIVSLSDVQKAAPEFHLQDFLPIPKNALTLLSAAGGTGKTFLSLQFALRLANQSPAAKVLLWLTEDDKSIIKHRSDLLLSNVLNYAFTDDKIDLISDMPEHLSGNNSNAYMEIFKPYDLIVLDPLIAFFAGQENDNSQARFFMNILNTIARKNTQSILILHHFSKAFKDQDSRSRGASAFVDAVRLAYEITDIPDNIDNSTKRITVTKDNYGVKYLLNADFKDITILPCFDNSIMPVSESKSNYQPGDLQREIENNRNQDEKPSLWSMIL